MNRQLAISEWRMAIDWQLAISNVAALPHNGQLLIGNIWQFVNRKSLICTVGCN